MSEQASNLTILGRTPASLGRSALPVVSLALVILAIAYFNPHAISYFGFNLMLNLGVPVALATIAQMLIITVNELDLSIGAFVSFTGCVVATWLPTKPAIGWAILLASVVAYALIGALIHLRRVPSIVVTLGMSFVWLGLAILIRPTPGGTAPSWLHALISVRVPYVPFPIVAAIVVGIVVHVGLMRSSYGTMLRGVGGNAAALQRAGWSVLKAKMVVYALAGVFGVLSGMALVGISTSADANMANGYTLLSIAGAILGGAEFVGGRVSPIGAILGALTLQLTAVALNFFHLPAYPSFRIPQEWQVGAQGIILILILALRALMNRGER
ncbi:ABC transporter permease [Lichenicola cladoniae]|uniref:Autoinducer 2 import system permease protein LsrD n=1 Tax=Lichenicola cladoniae TaxID=1484109 RepID=A0A6M8HM41_9PROT|nr:ABC transporter permease [Lichenicola cladoniae]NPD69951.1 ABC transporter permease [Acetobacteraceae bacterium]QKE89371.1 ABC transporter permease [Lichenicola cladoniae]